MKEAIPNIRDFPKIPKLKDSKLSKNTKDTEQLSIPFKSLNMKKMDTFGIPEVLIEIDLGLDTSSFSYYQNMIKDSRKMQINILLWHHVCFISRSWRIL